ncbi:adenine deaminase [Acidocella sp.]|uniref:adenine deaminase n=1 Tax=Acidocella sp. TaxID=50710 RepID=UPI003D066B61
MEKKSKLPPGFLERCIDQAIGRMPADLVIKGVKFLNLVTGEIAQSDIAITGERIIGTYESYEGTREIDGRGLIAVPGFIDTHVHCESTLVAPSEFDRIVLPRGTTTAICDPHEICNVLGTEGLSYFADSASALAMDLRVQLSSCVPATGMETSGAELRAGDLLPYLSHPKVLGLAEFMNFPGVLHKDPVVMEKLYAFSGEQIDGHAPKLSGRDLNAYLSCGIRNCHETTSLPEAWEKLRKGMHLLIREGTVTRDVRTLSPALTPETSLQCSFCTDDRNPLDIFSEGHLDFLVRKAIASGVPTLHAYRAVSYAAARGFGLRDRGLIAPGQRADIVLLEDLESCAVKRVIAGGRIVDEIDFAARAIPAFVGLNSMKLDPVSAEDFIVPASGPTTAVIGIELDKIVTHHLTMTLPYRNGRRQVDLENDVMKIAVLARHGKNRNIGRGFVKGFGFRNGALASSVGHDSHNVCVAGTDDAQMALAVNRLIELGGGFVAVSNGQVVGEMSLRMAGLMSVKSAETVRDELQALRIATRAMGCPLGEPFLHLAFMPLPVIPHLKITDMGVVDVDKFELVA